MQASVQSLRSFQSRYIRNTQKHQNFYTKRQARFPFKHKQLISWKHLIDLHCTIHGKRDSSGDSININKHFINNKKRKKMTRSDPGHFWEKIERMPEMAESLKVVPVNPANS